MSTTKGSEWIENEHKYIWYQPIDWNDFVEFIGGDPDNPVWPGKDSGQHPLKNEPGQTSGEKWKDWWRFYWSWEEKFNNRKLPDNLPDWAKPNSMELSDENIQYWMKHWKSFVSRHWKAWEKHGKPRPDNNNSSIEYNAIIAWGADTENPPAYIEQD